MLFFPGPTMKKAFCLAVISALPITPLYSQQSSFVYKLGKDTVAVEQFTRTAKQVTGEVASRSGAVVTRTTYDGLLGADGRISSITYRIFGAEGRAIKGRPVEVRYVVTGDSAKREILWGDSTSVRTVGAANAMPFVAPSYGLLEVAFAAMRKGMPATFPVMGLSNAAALPTMAFTMAGGDSIRQASGLTFRVDRDGRLLTYDGTSTTGKQYATRGTGGLNVAQIASTMKPLGALSARGTARAAFQTTLPGGVLMIDYGRPLVRDRTVWGGLLIPLDTIWRLGANDATHFATGRDLTFGDVTIPAGLYTLFMYNAKSGPMLVVNKQTGQWGTVYDQKNDVARIPLTMATAPEFTEEFTINVKQAAPSRGAIEIVWGPQMATTSFVVK